MVKVFVDTKGTQIQRIKVTGHADFGPHGQDLVCAGVSSITVGILNALDLLANDSCQFKMDAGLVLIEVLDCNNATVQTILQTLVIQLTTMEESYQKFIRINKQEV